jgi:beta-glucanase (GH16 family)
MKTKTFHSLPLTAVCLFTLAGCAPDESPPLEPAGEELTVVEQEEQSYNPGAEWKQVWADEFNGDSLNTNNWTTLKSNWDPVTNNCNFGTGDLTYPRAQNVSVGNGVLTITAQRTNEQPMDAHCTGFGPRSFYSGRIHSKGKVERKYGKLVASIKVPGGYGMWPAFWTLGANISQVGWPQCGEIDIQEWHSSSPSWMKVATHWDPNGHWGAGADHGSSLANSFHVYEVEWNENRITFRVDGKVANNVFTNNKPEFMAPHYIILNLALGGDWYGNPGPASIDLAAGEKKTLQVQWIRWFQKA